jgi:hypothetical protein
VRLVLSALVCIALYVTFVSPSSHSVLVSASLTPPANCATFLSADEAYAQTANVLFISETPHFADTYRNLAARLMPQSTVTVHTEISGGLATAALPRAEHTAGQAGWTHIVLHEQSHLPGLVALQKVIAESPYPERRLLQEANASRAAVRKFAALLGSSTLVVLEPWAWRDGDSTVNTFGSFESMQRFIEQGTHMLAADARQAAWESAGAAGGVQVRVAPVGSAVRHIFAADAEQLRPPAEQMSEHGRTHVGQRESHVGGGTLFSRLYEQDGVRLAPAGMGLVALVLAHTLHGLRPSAGAPWADVGKSLGFKEVVRLGEAAERAVSGCSERMGPRP